MLVGFLYNPTEEGIDCVHSGSRSPFPFGRGKYISTKRQTAQKVCLENVSNSEILSEDGGTYTTPRATRNKNCSNSLFLCSTHSRVGKGIIIIHAEVRMFIYALAKRNISLSMHVPGVPLYQALLTGVH